MHNACWQNFRHFARLCIGKYICNLYWSATSSDAPDVGTLFAWAVSIFFSNRIRSEIKSLFDEFKLISLIP